MITKIGFLASHGGTSARAIYEACRDGRLTLEPVVLICNNSGAVSLAWAREVGLAHHHLSGRTHPGPDSLDGAICGALESAETDLVVLSGYMKKLGDRVVRRFRNRILNIHPAPLPRFGGKGMYGLNVHQAVLDAGLDQTSVTVHLVDERYDHGPTVHHLPVTVGDIASAEDLQRRVGAVEPEVYVEALQLIVDGTVDLDALC